MITLITGGPGLGKTALAIDLIQKEYAGRTLFSNVRGLTLDHAALPKVEEWTTQKTNDQGVEEYEFAFPAGSIIVIDECQRFFPPRASGSKVPPALRAFETHRHTGVDFILITQGTRLLDVHLRSLVKGGRHIFLHKAFLNRYRFERNECIDEDDRSSRALASKRKYKLPTHVFNLYKSSELHTKPARAKLPIQAYVLGIALIALVAVGFRIYQRTNERFPDKNKIAQHGAVEGTAQPSPVPHNAKLLFPVSLTEVMTPTDSENPLSAPLYQDVKPQITPPKIEVCISSRKNCTCYSQQQTPIWLPDTQCRNRAAGKYYDPYQQPPASQTQRSYAYDQGGKATAPKGLEPPAQAVPPSKQSALQAHEPTS
jgi:zona occludens toxin